MARKSFGKAVVGGTVRYTSASALTRADPNNPYGCLRSWWYRYVAGIKEPEKPWQADGVAFHAEIERYLKTGEKALSPAVMAGVRFIPTPGPDLLIEAPLHERGELAVEGIPVVGYIDCVHERSSSVDTRGELVTNPAGCVEVVDWKFTGDVDRKALAGGVLPDTVQMALYARWAFENTPAEWVRLSHVYFQTKGKSQSKKSTILVQRERIDRSWESVRKIARSVIDAAKCTTADEVEPNTRACRWCHYKDQCPGGREKTLEDFFGPGAAAELLGTTQQTGSDIMGVLDKLKVNKEIEALKAEEAKASKPAVDSEFADAVTRIERLDQGFPTLAGAAMRMFADLRGLDAKGDGLAGTGRLGALTILDVADVISLAGELEAEAASAGVDAPAEPDATALLPPDAPDSDPALAATPVEGYGDTPADVPMVTNSDPEPPAPNLDAVARVRVTEAELHEAAEATLPERPEKLSKKAREYIEALEAKLEAAEARPTWTAVVAEREPTPEPEGVRLFIDCIPSDAFESLDPYLDALCDMLCEKYGVVDVRCAPKDCVPLAYGAWRGAVSALIKASPPPAGAYVLDTRGRDIAEAAADALRQVATLTVRGVR